MNKIRILVVTTIILYLAMLNFAEALGPPDFTLLDTQDDGGYYFNVWSDGTYEYAACAGDGIRAYTFDGTSFNLLDTHYAGVDVYQGVWGDGTYIYAACAGDGIRAYTFDGTSFALVDTQSDTGNYQNIWGDGTYIYVACYDSGIYAYTFDGVDFTLLDTSYAGSNYYDLWGDGTYIYAACYADGIRAYSFDGSDFTLKDTQDDGYCYDLWGDGTYIYAACLGDGVRAYTFDGSDFALLDTQDDGDDYYGVWYDGTYVYTACWGSGIRAYTFDGTNFVLKDTQDDDGNYRAVYGDGTYIYVACTANGIYAYTFRRPLGDVYVDDDAGPGWYNATHVKTIKEGINNSTSGQYVYVYSGNYSENVKVNKSLTIRGEDNGSTFIWGGASHGVVINVSNVSFSGFTVNNTGDVGILIGDDSTTGDMRNVTVSGCIVHDISTIGIYVISWGGGVDVSNCSIVNCVVYDSDEGISVDNVPHINITNCTVYSCDSYGIYPRSQSVYFNITNCTIRDNNNHGLYIAECDNSIIRNCSVYNNALYGFRFAASTNTTWRDNAIYNNTRYELVISTSDVYDYQNDVDISNTVRGKPIYWYFDQDDIALNESSNAGFVCFASGDNVSISNVNVSSLHIGYTTNSTVDNVTVYYGSDYGIYLPDLSNSYIMNCNVSVDGTGAYAIFLASSYLNNIFNNDVFGAIGVADVSGNNNTIYENNVSNCMYGVYLSSTSDDLVYGNNFIGNTLFQAYDEMGTRNKWNRSYDDYPICGNYWDNYTGVDNFGGPLQDQPGSDDIGDTSIGVVGGSTDHYPLMDENEWWQEHPVTSLRITATKNVPDVVGVADSVASVVGVILIILSIMSIIAVVSKFGQ